MDEQREFLEFLNFLRAERRRELQPQKHYGFGLPKHYRVVDAVTGTTVTAVEHKDVAEQVAANNAELIGHRFEVHGMWTNGR